MSPRLVPPAAAWRRAVAVLHVALGLAAALCAVPLSAATVSGTATYRERIALPPAAVFEATLQDIARADAPAQVVARMRLEPAGQPPFAFRLVFDPAQVTPRARLAVRATVVHEGRLLFTSDRVHAVAVDGSTPPLQITMVRVGAPPEVAPASATLPIGLPASFAGDLPGAGGPVRWQVDLLEHGTFQLRLEYPGRPAPNRFDDVGRWRWQPAQRRLVLEGGREAAVFLALTEDGHLRKLDTEGRPIASMLPDRLVRLPAAAPIEPRLTAPAMFTVLADAASIELCADGRRMPVAMVGDYAALERAYLDRRAGPGEALLVSAEWTIGMRPSADPSAPARTTATPERFVRAYAGQACTARATERPLHGTEWRLVWLDGAPVAPGTAARDPHLRFDAASRQVGGSSGCNTIGGQYEGGDDGALRIGRLAGTMMACPPPAMALEASFTSVLARVASQAVRGDLLELFDAERVPIARFQATR